MGHSLFCFGLIGSDCNRGNCRLERNSLCLRGHDGAWPSSFFGGMRSRASASVQAPPTLTYGYALCGAPYLDASAVMTQHGPPVFWRDALPRVRECSSASNTHLRLRLVRRSIFGCLCGHDGAWPSSFLEGCAPARPRMFKRPQHSLTATPSAALHNL
jgi:hypothetical protein